MASPLQPRQHLDGPGEAGRGDASYRRAIARPETRQRPLRSRQCPVLHEARRGHRLLSRVHRARPEIVLDSKSHSQRPRQHPEEEGLAIGQLPRPEAPDPKRALETSKEAVELAPQSLIDWQTLGWVQYRAGNWKASLETLEKSCKLQNSGDSGQWIVMSLAHWRLANEKELPEQERDRHKTEASRWYDQAVKEIDSWSAREDWLAQSIRAFRVEAAGLLGVKEKQK